MSNFEDQKPPIYGGETQDAWDEIEVSDLPPDRRVHHLLLHLNLVRVDQVVKQLKQQVSAGTDERQLAPQRGLDELDLEITALPPDRREHYLLLKLQGLARRLRALLNNGRDIPVRSETTPAPGRPRARVRLRQMLTVFSLCAVLMLLLLGNVAALRNNLIGLFQPSVPAANTTQATISTGGGSRIEVRGRSEIIPLPSAPGLGPIPTTCPRNSALQNTSQLFGVPVLGLGPIWAMGFAGPSAALIQLMPAATSMSRPPGAVFGWYAVITLFIPKGYTGNILLRGSSQKGNDMLAFSNINMLYMNSYLTLNTHNPGTTRYFSSTGEWDSIPLNVFVPVAGCYYLQANWNNQIWTTYFAAGLHI